MRYTGNFVRSFATDKDVKPQYPAPEHAGGGDLASVRPGLESKLVPVDDNYVGTDFPSYDVVGGGFELFHHLDTHDSEGVTYPLYTDEQQLETIAMVHSDPNRQGGSVASRWSREQMQDARTVYGYGIREDVSPIPENAPVLANRKAGWGYSRNYGDVSPRLGIIREDLTRIIRRQNRRAYHYTPQPLTQRQAGMNGMASAQKSNLLNNIPGWVKQQSGHKNTRVGVANTPELLDVSLLAEGDSQYYSDGSTFGETMF